MPNGGGRIPDPVLAFFIALLSVGAIVAFALLFGNGIADVWGAEPDSPPTYNDAFLYVATTVSALVGGIVAVGFGVSHADDDDGGGGGGGGGAELLTVNLRGLSRLALPSLDAGAIIGSLYALVYILLGIAAVATWVTMPAETSALVKNLATTFLGLAVPIVAGYFRR